MSPLGPPPRTPPDDSDRAWTAPSPWTVSPVREASTQATPVRPASTQTPSLETPPSSAHRDGGEEQPPRGPTSRGGGGRSGGGGGGGGGGGDPTERQRFGNFRGSELPKLLLPQMPAELAASGGSAVGASARTSARQSPSAREPSSSARVSSLSARSISFGRRGGGGGGGSSRARKAAESRTRENVDSYVRSARDAVDKLQAEAEEAESARRLANVKVEVLREEARFVNEMMGDDERERQIADATAELARRADEARAAEEAARAAREHTEAEARAKLTEADERHRATEHEWRRIAAREEASLAILRDALHDAQLTEAARQRLLVASLERQRRKRRETM